MLPALLLVAIASGAERPAPGPRPIERLALGTAVLDGGLRVVVVHRPGWSTVSIAAVVEGGLAGEPEPGLALALAEAWLGSRPQGPSVMDEYTRLGASVDVRVEPDVTAFWTHGPASAGPAMLALERQRLADPLLRAADPAQPGSTGRRPFHQDARWLGPVYEALYPEDHPYHGIWRTPDPAGYPLFAAQALAARSWTPERTTLVIAGPMAPVDVLCTLDSARCDGVPDMRVVEAALTLPASALDGRASKGLPRPRYVEVGPIPGPVDEPVAVLAWSLPGSDGGSAGPGIDAFAASWMEKALGRELTGRRPTRCRIREGRVNRTLLCVGPGTDLDPGRLRRRLVRGWPSRGLEEAVAHHRAEQMAGLLGATDDPEHVRRMAEQVHEGADPSVHAGRLEALGYGAADVRAFLEDVVSADRMVVVQFEP